MDQDQVYWIAKLGLTAHPEGGFFKETYRSIETLDRDDLPARYAGPRCFSTAIYFLLPAQDFSSFHRIQSDEIWHYHTGGILQLYLLHEGKLTVKTLGPPSENGADWQVVIPRGAWFAGEVVEGNFVLASCTVAPGFDFADFELARQQELTALYPDHLPLIHRLTRA